MSGGGPRIPSTVMGVMVAEVYTRPVSTKYGDKTVWTVVTPDGTKWESWKNDIGNKALSLKGQLADLKVEIAQNGDYTNYNLLQIRAAAGPGVAQAAQAAQAAQPTGEVSYEAYAQAAQQAQAAHKEKEDRKQESIHRQVAAKVAAAVTTAEDGAAGFWATVEAVYAYFQSGLIPAAFTSSVTSHTASPDLTPDDDIPF